MKQSKKSELMDWGKALVEALVILFIIKKFLFGLYYVPSGSAEPNLLVGDRVFGNKISYYFQPIQRSDYVIFDNPTFDYQGSSGLQRWWQENVGIKISLLGLPNGPENVVKRVIGVPGDIIPGRPQSSRDQHQSCPSGCSGKGIQNILLSVAHRGDPGNFNPGLVQLAGYPG